MNRTYVGVLVLVALGGCTPKDGDEGGSTEASSEATSGASTAVTEDGPTTGADAMPTGTAFLRLDKPPDGTLEPEPGDPTDLMVDVGSFPLVCAEPYLFPACGPDLFYRYSFVLTPAQQQPGTYKVADLAATLNLQSTEDSPCESNGPFPAELGGSVEVISIDATGLVVRLIGTEEDFVGSEGEYTVVRCAG